MIGLRQAPPSDDEIIQWSVDNPGFRFEYVNGEVTVSPTTGRSGVRQSTLTFKLAAWASANGYASFGSSTLFHFGDLQVSPDGVLIRKDRFAALTEDEQDETVTLVPDITVEIVSNSQSYGKTRRGVLPKCKAMNNAGVCYVVMLDPYAQTLAERVMQWGTPPPNFPTDWDDVLNA